MSRALAPGGALLLAAFGLLLAGRCGCSPQAARVPRIAAYFGTKTRYEDVNAPLRRDPRAVNRSVLRPPATERCSPVHLTAVVRHGSRYPTAKNIRRIQRLDELVRGSGGPEGVGSGGPGASEGWLQDIQSRWEMWYTEDMDGEDMTSHPCVQLLS